MRGRGGGKNKKKASERERESTCCLLASSIQHVADAFLSLPLSFPFIRYLNVYFFTFICFDVFKHCAHTKNLTNLFFKSKKIKKIKSMENCILSLLILSSSDNWKLCDDFCACRNEAKFCVSEAEAVEFCGQVRISNLNSIKIIHSIS